MRTTQIDEKPTLQHTVVHNYSMDSRAARVVDYNITQLWISTKVSALAEVWLCFHENNENQTNLY
ncbi:hypothetical protein T4B_842 [Trichinella pseudospiralis]|uniref:Uncharacterized protein n=1 Tax=Trichinella pseudospiralis TaxID=6337 RepID=A0A0V1I625_TRIPS|nr:hypothetical protein T4A_2453 [Trichinella pseudospiralis]KRZ18246.1 hypothetical protein T4B_842 [Trichinella pseudospiralis]